MSSLYENPSCEITHGSFTPRDEDVDVDVESLSPVRTEPVATPPVSPPVRVKRMRGSIGGSLDINREKLFGQHHSRPKASAAKSSTVRSGGSRKKKSAKNDPLNWQIVVYKPLPFPLNLLRSVPEKAKKRLPKPFAIREHVPGMRIRGARVMPGKERQKDGRATGKPAMDKKPNHVEQPVDKKRKHAEPPVTILSDSESELEVRPEHVALVDHRDQAEASTSKSAVQIKKQPGNRNRTVPTTRPNYGSDMSARARVKDVLDKFDSLRRRFLREDENRAKNAEKGSGGKRADLRASSILMEKGFRVNGSESIEGPVPGVDVGDHFYYRMELLIISLHRQSQGGIDYIPSNRSKHRDKNGNPLAVAVSVIASGGYEDDKDEGDILIYTGQGGNNYKGDKRQGHDQELVRGNLALKNCCDLGLSVRVIRGYEVKKSDGTTSPSGKIYYYDGLYDVKDCYQDMGSAGYKVWKYKLIRKEGQPQLVSPLILFTRKSSPPLLFGNRGEKILLDDISKGLEPMKVRVVGLMDDPTLPESFEYIVKLKFTKGIPRLEPAKACSCSKECLETCPCLKWNRGEPPYNENGSLIRGKKAIYECGLQCHCGSECHSRVSQKGIHHNLEIFRTENRGWGVRSTNFIPQGSFICEYVGEVVHTSEAELRVSADEYLLDLNVPKNMKQRFGDLSGLFDEASDRDDENEGDEALTSCEKWTVDACQYGNVGRFINHSCDGNLFVQRVFYDHHDMRFPHVMLFAMEKISPFQELTYDYSAAGRRLK